MSPGSEVTTVLHKRRGNSGCRTWSSLLKTLFNSSDSAVLEKNEWGRMYVKGGIGDKEFQWGWSEPKGMGSSLVVSCV